MSDFLGGFVIGALAAVGVCFVALRSRNPSPAKTIPPVVAPAPDESPASAVEIIETPDDIATILTELSATLSPLAEQVDHPRALPAMPAFQAVVTAFRRPDATFALLSQYALGGNWPMACAAFLVLAERPERQALCEPALRHLENTRPYVLMYAFQFLAALRNRPPVGAAVLAAPAWWKDNPVIPGFFHDYFARSAQLGDAPEFGDLLSRKPDLATASVIGLLEKIHHPFATSLLGALRGWEATKIDRRFLSSVGALWNPADQDLLLARPESWRESLSAAQSAMLQPRARSVLISGDPRIGKSAFVELLGAELQKAGWTIFSASGADLMAGQIYIGQLEGRIRQIVEALHARRKLIWYVRDLGQMANSGTHRGQAASILDQILPAVAAGDLIIIGEVSRAAATRLFQSRPSLRSLIDVLPLAPMDEEETLALAGEVGKRIADHLGLVVSPQAVEATMELAQHYLGDGQLPGSALELLKRAAKRSVQAGDKALTVDSVLDTLSQLSGLPRIILDTSQKVELTEVREFFASRVIGQDEAVKSVVDRIAMLKAGLTDPGRPIGVFLFAGPTGTGKTELAKTLAEFLFGSPDRMTRLDMSEFQTQEATSKILGQRGESEADSLIDRIRKQPFSVVLLDEFEKAHPNCWDLFLQIFDDGRLSDANGREADFRHCFIILTSNLGATSHRSAGLGFRPSAESYGGEQVLRAIAQTFRPEFINRLDKTIVFQPLSRDLMRGILHKELARVLERRGLRERSWAVEWESSAIEFLLDRGFSPEMGARPLKRAIDQLLLAPLAAKLVEHRFPQGDQFLFVRSNGKQIEVEFVDPDAEPTLDSAPEAEPDGHLSLASIVLRQTGSAAERASLAAFWREMSDEMAAPKWIALGQELRSALADPAIWSREDRQRVFTRAETADRVREAARTAERLFQRYNTAREPSARASRELAARLASQLFGLRRGLDDVAVDAPTDALLRVEPAMESGGERAQAAVWCESLMGMYRQWAAKRRMQIAEISPDEGKSAPILHVIGFGAFRTLQAEAGLHVLDDPTQDNARRIVARVAVVAGPERAFRDENAAAEACRLLDIAAPTSAIVRRYREGPAPIVRDVAAGWRSGRLDAVLGGDFDLLSAVARRQPGDD
jgi:ATP-dependent Clp protease ATP-binding subunit ClpC